LLDRDQQHPPAEEASPYLKQLGLGRGAEAKTGHLAKLPLTPLNGEAFAAVQPVVPAVARTARIMDVEARHPLTQLR
jgi:hypothetical protein